MIHVPFDPQTLHGEQRDWWKRWSTRADTATRAAIDAHEEGGIIFKAKIWAELREWLFQNVFHGKCAYCEGKVRPQSWGAAEHWRPKKRVSTRRDGVECTLARDGEEHPGYYWLAYEWQNILPVCDTCNAGKAKGTQFPVAGSHAFSPGEGATTGELNRYEQPLLLHPFRGGEYDPGKHIYFDEFGIPHPHPNSEHGRVSIDVFWLDREDLNDDRRKRYEELARVADDAIGVAAKRLETISERIQDYVAPDGVYSQAGKDFIRVYVPRLLDELREQALFD
ncbi:MAG TPA: hypothetical protein VFY36_10305 [Solirubrobacteraceae bacterium]|nr:hypothetical protein [Solirubrobacteraceae bacterium]